MVESLRAPPAPPRGPRGPRDELLVLRLGRPEPPAAGEAPQGGPGTPGAGAAADRHVVQPGESLGSIARDILGSALLAEDLARLNGLAPDAALEPGRVLRLR